MGPLERKGRWPLVNGKGRVGVGTRREGRLAGVRVDHCCCFFLFGMFRRGKEEKAHMPHSLLQPRACHHCLCVFFCEDGANAAVWPTSSIN